METLKIWNLYYYSNYGEKAHFLGRFTDEEKVKQAVYYRRKANGGQFNLPNGVGLEDMKGVSIEEINRLNQCEGVIRKDVLTFNDNIVPEKVEVFGPYQTEYKEHR